MTREYYCKDMEFECPYCGRKKKISKMLKKASPNIYDYEEISYPAGFNPFDKKESSYSDRITIMYDYECKCGRRFDLQLVCNCFAVEITDRDTLAVHFSEYTKKDD